MTTARPRNGFSAANRAPSGQILVVEDEPAMARCLVRVAKRYGKVTAAPTVCDAMHQLDGDVEWTALIVDVGLPDGSGLDVLARARRKAPDVPALVITGLLQHDAINAAFEFRARCLVKPVTNAQIDGFLRLTQRTVRDPQPAAPSNSKDSTPVPGCRRAGASAPESSPSDEPRPGRPDRRPRVSAVTAHVILRMAEAAVEDLRARYDLGRLVHQLRSHSDDNATMGTLAGLARAYHLAPGTLRRLARVTEIIGPEEFDEYLMLRSPYGLPLTWSHIEELAESRRRDVRRRCAAEVLTEALSVADLRARVRAAARE